MNTLKAERRWCCWNKDKQPYISGSNKGRSNMPDTWLSYDAAEKLAASEEMAGIGFFLSRRENAEEFCLCVIDIDAHHSDGEPNPNAETVLEDFADTYIEVSPSGNGYHIICNVKADRVPLDCNDRPDYLMKNADEELEIYIGGFTNRFMTYTGNQYSESDEITDQTDKVLAFLTRYMQKPEKLRSNRIQSGELLAVPVQNVDIRERLNIARRSKYGKEFVALYDEGDISYYHDDHSRADLGLARKLCYWLGPYSEKIDEAFRGSKLMREKWDERRGGSTYGERTIEAAIAAQEAYYIPPTASGEQFVENGMDELQSTVVINEASRDADTTICNTQITAEDILTMINAKEEDDANRDKITVMPLMCGSGKSTAIRLKIRQIIEANNGEGIIIVTDSTDRMRDYLKPSDEELSTFFQDYRHLITVMTYETYVEDKKTEPECPILIMSTQRFVGLSKRQINDYLKWNGGTRSLIIFDEQPYFTKQVDITIESLNQISSAIDMGIHNTRGDFDSIERLKENWGVIERYLKGVIDSLTKSFHQAGQYYQWQTVNWSNQGLFDQIFDELYKNRHKLNGYRRNGKIVDVYSIVRAVYQLLTEGALATIQIDNSGNTVCTLSVLLDNHSKFENLQAKVIVLDGTADLSTSYKLYDSFDYVECEAYKRDLSRLHIKPVNMKTGKRYLQINVPERAQMLAAVKAYLDEHIPEGERKVVFSYKFLMKELEHDYGRGNFAWFGVIKGSNDFRDAKYITQIGLNRYTDASYFLFELTYDKELKKNLKLMPYPEHTAFIKKRMNASQGFTRQAMINELLAELEQNIFRGTIRNSDNAEDYTFFLFTSLKHRYLINALVDRYQPLHAHVDDPDLPTEDATMAFMTRNNSGKKSIAQRIVEYHDTRIAVGDLYFYSNIEEELGITYKQIKAAREQNATLNKLFSEERVSSKDLPAGLESSDGRLAVYQKTDNWYYEESTN